MRYSGVILKNTYYKIIQNKKKNTISMILDYKLIVYVVSCSVSSFPGGVAVFL